MSNQRSVMTEFRSLEQKRLTSGLTGEEELRLEELRELVGPEVAPPPSAGFDVGAAASRLRESLLPAGLRSRPLEMGPPPAPSPQLSAMFEPAPEPEPVPETPWAGADDATPEPAPEPEPVPETPWAGADDATPEAAFEVAPEPEAWPATPTDPPPGEVRPQAWNPEAPGYDPDAPFDEAAWIAAGYDPNVTYDWSAAGYDLGDQPAADGGEPSAAGVVADLEPSLLEGPPVEAASEGAAPGPLEAAPGWPEPGAPLVAEAGWPGAPEPLVEGLAAEADHPGGPVPLEVEEAPWLDEEAAAPAAPAPEADATPEPWIGAGLEATGLAEPLTLAADDLAMDAAASPADELPPPAPSVGVGAVEDWADAPFAAQPVHPGPAAPPAPAPEPAPVEEPLPFDPNAPFDHAKWFGRRDVEAAEPEVPAAWLSAAASPVLEPELEPEPSVPEVAAPELEPQPTTPEETPAELAPAVAPQAAASLAPELGHQPLAEEAPIELEPTLELDLTRTALVPEPAWAAAPEAEPPSPAPAFGDYDEAGGAVPRAFSMVPAGSDLAPAAAPGADPASAWFDETAAITGHLPAPPSAAFGEYDESTPATRMGLDLGEPSFERTAPPAAPTPDLGLEAVEEGFEPGGPALDPAALAPLAPEPEEDFGQGHLYGGPEAGALPGGSPLDLGDPAAEWHPESALEAGFELASDGSFGHPDPAESGAPAWSGPAAASPPSAEGWESAPALDLSAPFEGEPLATVPVEEDLPTLAADDLLELAPEPAAAEPPALELASPPPAQPEPAWADDAGAVAAEVPVPELAPEPAAAEPEPAWASEPELVAPGLDTTPAAWATEATFQAEVEAEAVEAAPAEAEAAAPSHGPEPEPGPERAEPYAAAEPLELAPQPTDPEPAALVSAAPEEAAPPEPPPEAAPPQWEPEPSVSYEPPPPGLTLPPEIAAAYPDAPATGAFELPPALSGGLFDDLPAEPEPAAPPPAPAPQVRIEGSCRVVLHTVDGQVRRGLLCDTFLDDAALTLLPQGPGAPEEIPAAAIKAIFFMLSPGEKAPPPDGRKVRVTFRDGRQVAGYSPDYQEGSVGFFMIPADTRTNTGRIWVYQAAVRQVTVS